MQSKSYVTSTSLYALFVWCPARPAKRDLFNNIMPILLHPQAMLKFKRLSMEALSAKIPYCNKQEQRIKLSILAITQRDSSPKKESSLIYSPSYCSKPVLRVFWKIFQVFLSTQWKSHRGPKQHWTSLSGEKTLNATYLKMSYIALHRIKKIIQFWSMNKYNHLELTVSSVPSSTGNCDTFYFKCVNG